MNFIVGSALRAGRPELDGAGGPAKEALALLSRRSWDRSRPPAGGGAGRLPSWPGSRRKRPATELAG